MLSKNNKQEKLRKLEEKNNRFSIRKFTVGAASVLIGAFFMGVSETQTAHADTTPATEQVAASNETADSANKVEQPATSENDKTPVATNQTSEDGQTLQSQFDQAAKNPGKSASSANTALNNASDAELTEMANDYNAGVAQHADPNPAQSQSEKDGTAYAPTDQAYSDPKTYIENADKMPAGTKYSWITSQSDLSKMLMEPGQHTISILVTYPDGSTTKVTGPYLNVTGSDVQTVTVVQGSDASSIKINDAVTDIVPAGNRWDPQSAKWTILPDTSVAGVTMGQAEVVFASGNKQLVVIPVRVTPAPTQTVTDKVYQEIDVHVPNSDSFYWKDINQQTMTGTKTADGTETWNSVSYNAQSVDSVLAAQGFTNNKTGYKQTLPTLDGYVAKIDAVQVIGGNPAGNDPRVKALLAELDKKIAANPYELPAYSTDYPFSVVFQVTFVQKSSSNGDPLTQPDLPEAPLPQEPDTPSTPSDNNNDSGQPDDTNDTNVTPLPNDNSDKGENNGKTSKGNSTKVVKAHGVETNSAVHAAVVNNGQKKENTLPQTGEKNTNIAGVAGLLALGLGIFGLAVRRRKN